MASFTKREQSFIDEYFICGLRGSDAARRLGSKSPRMYAHRMLSNVNIQAEIDRRLAQHKLSANMVLARLSDMAMSNIADFADIQNSSDLKKYRYKTHVIKKFKKKTITTKDGEIVTDFELELYPADNALINLGRHWKLFTDNVRLTDWRTELLDLLQQGKVTEQEIEVALGTELATEFFKSSGLQLAGIRENQEVPAE